MALSDRVRGLKFMKKAEETKKLHDMQQEQSKNLSKSKIFFNSDLEQNKEYTVEYEESYSAFFSHKSIGKISNAASAYKLNEGIITESECQNHISNDEMAKRFKENENIVQWNSKRSKAEKK